MAHKPIQLELVAQLTHAVQSAITDLERVSQIDPSFIEKVSGLREKLATFDAAVGSAADQLSFVNSAYRPFRRAVQGVFHPKVDEFVSYFAFHYTQAPPEFKSQPDFRSAYFELIGIRQTTQHTDILKRITEIEQLPDFPPALKLDLGLVSRTFVPILSAYFTVNAALEGFHSAILGAVAPVPSQKDYLQWPVPSQLAAGLNAPNLNGDSISAVKWRIQQKKLKLSAWGSLEHQQRKELRQKSARIKRQKEELARAIEFVAGVSDDLFTIPSKALGAGDFFSYEETLAVRETLCQMIDDQADITRGSFADARRMLRSLFQEHPPGE
jgi:hypothetical protein